MDESCYINESVLLNYFAGELPADRRKEVEEWIAASEDNEKMARDIFRLYRAADTLDYMNRVDASAALQQVKGRIQYSFQYTDRSIGYGVQYGSIPDG